MPLAHLLRTVQLRGVTVPTSQPGVLLREDDRFTFLDPQTDNELVRGATRAFIDHEVAQGRLLVDGYPLSLGALSRAA